MSYVLKFSCLHTEYHVFFGEYKKCEGCHAQRRTQNVAHFMIEWLSAIKMAIFVVVAAKHLIKSIVVNSLVSTLYLNIISWRHSDNPKIFENNKKNHCENDQMWEKIG